MELPAWLIGPLGLDPLIQHRILVTLVLVAAAWLLRRLIHRGVDLRTEDVRQRYQWRKRSTYVIVVLCGLLITWVWFEGVGSLATFLGLVSAGLAIALKDLVADVAGWTFILWRKPFEVGDRIQIGEHRGDVIDIRIFQFSLLEIGNWVHADQSTGRVIHIPNWKVFSESQANYTRGFRFIWNELRVLVTFESDWRAAKEILNEIVHRHTEHLSEQAARQVREASSRYMIFYSTLTPKVYTSVEDSGVMLTLRFLCDPRKRRGTDEAIWEDILTAFAERVDIDFAYPSVRYFDHRTEGKPALDASGDAP